MLNCQSDFLYVGGDAEQDAWLAEFPQQASTDKDKTEADPISQKSVFFPWTWPESPSWGRLEIFAEKSIFSSESARISHGGRAPLG